MTGAVFVALLRQLPLPGQRLLLTPPPPRHQVDLGPRSSSVECRSNPSRSEVAAGAISNLLICLNYGVFQSSCLLAAASVKSIQWMGFIYILFSFFGA